MNGVKAVYETLTQGPIKVRVLAIYSLYGLDGLPLELLCRVTSRNNRIYPAGYLIVSPSVYLWEKHSYVGKFKCRHSWRGRPALSGLPEADNTLLQKLCNQHP